MMAAPFPAAPPIAKGTAIQIDGLRAAPPQPMAISAIEPA